MHRDRAADLSGPTVDGGGRQHPSDQVPIWLLGLLDTAAISRKRAVFEYWAHEASYLPVATYPLMRWRMERAERGEGMYGGLAKFGRERAAYIEGIFREMKLRNYYEKPSERRVREKAEAVRRARKLARKKLQREGLLPSKPAATKTPGRAGPGRGGPGAGGAGGGGGGGAGGGSGGFGGGSGGAPRF